MSEAALDLAASRARDYRRMLAASAALHVGLCVALVVGKIIDPFDDYELPAGPIIEMVTPAELAARTAEAAPTPKPKPRTEPKPEPVAQPEPPPPPVDQIIIPEDTHRKPTPAKPKPEPVREVETRPVQADEEEVDLEEFLLEQRLLEGEMPGQTKPDAKPQVVPGAGGTGAPDSPEIAAWKQKVRAHIKRNWGVQPGFRGKGLKTLVSVTLTAGGDLLDHEEERSSGNPWFDDSVERYLEAEDALPAPPRSGEYQILFDGDL